MCVSVQLPYKERFYTLDSYIRLIIEPWQYVCRWLLAASPAALDYTLLDYFLQFHCDLFKNNKV